MCQVCEFYRWFFVELFPNHFAVYLIAAFTLILIWRVLSGDLHQYRVNPSKRPTYKFRPISLSGPGMPPKWLLVLIVTLLWMPAIKSIVVESVCGKGIMTKHGGGDVYKKRWCD